MSLISIVRKKKATGCSCGCSPSERAEKTTACRPETKGNYLCIKVLGAGCKSCRQQYENVKRAAAETGLAAEVEYITDMEKVMSYGVMSMPAIVINKKVVSMGKVLKTADVEGLLQKSGF